MRPVFMESNFAGDAGVIRAMLAASLHQQLMRKIFYTHAVAILLLLSATLLEAQEYVSTTAPTTTGRSPGVKWKLLSSTGTTKSYVVVFASGDEVKSGLTEFAQKNNVASAHFSAIGDAANGKVGWYDSTRKMFKVINIGEPAEVTSLLGNITTYQGKPAVHGHVTLSTADGLTHGGHLLELFVGPTLEVFLTVEPRQVFKKFDEHFGAAVIDPALEK